MRTVKPLRSLASHPQPQTFPPPPTPKPPPPLSTPPHPPPTPPTPPYPDHNSTKFFLVFFFFYNSKLSGVSATLVLVAWLLASYQLDQPPHPPYPDQNSPKFFFLTDSKPSGRTSQPSLWTPEPPSLPPPPHPSYPDQNSTTIFFLTIQNCQWVPPPARFGGLAPRPPTSQPSLWTPDPPPTPPPTSGSYQPAQSLNPPPTSPPDQCGLAPLVFGCGLPPASPVSGP